MSDFYSGEAHQNVSEFFPRKARTGKRSIKIPAAKMLAAIAGAAVTATLLFSAFVDCFASEILPTQATLNVSVMNLEREREVEWLLYEEGSDTPVQQGEMDSQRETIPIDNLDSDTKYRIVFITHTDDGEKQLGEYEFTTPGQKAPAVSPLPSAVPPPPAQPTPPAVSPSPSPSVAPSPSPSPSPSVAPSVAPSAQPQPTVAPSIEPSVEPSAEPSVEPSVEPSPSPEIPVPSAGTPVLSNITAGTDGGPASMTFNFPFSMNSTADYTNEFVDVEITYSSEDFGYPVDENAAVTVTAAPDANGNVTVGWPLYASQFGSTTAKATLRYNRINVSTGEVETDLTLDSDDLNVQALFVGAESEDSNGLAITNLEADSETDRLTGTVTIDVGKGTYPAKNSVSQLNVYRIWFDIYNEEGKLVNTTRDIAIDYENLSADNSSATITTNFDISIADLGLALGETYKLYVRANGEWLLNSNPVGTSEAFGFERFKYGEAPVYVEPEAGTSEISSYIAPTDNTYNGWVGQYSFIPNDAEIVSVTIDETITEYSNINGTQAGSTTSSATYTAEQINTSEDGSLIYAEHIGRTTMNANKYMYRYQATPVLTYTMPGDTTQKQLTGPSLDIDPYFYITYRDTAQSTNSMTINSVTDVGDGNVEIDFSAQIKDVHVGNIGTLKPMSVTVSYYSDSMGSNWIDVPADSYEAEPDGSITVTNAVITIPAERFNVYNELSLTLNVDSIWTMKIGGWDTELGRASASVSATAIYTHMLLLDLDVGLTDNTETGVDMILQSISMTYGNETDITKMPITGGETVQITYRFVGQVDSTDLGINVQISSSAGGDIIPGYSDVDASKVYTVDEPLKIVLEYQVPEIVTTDITLTSYCEISNQI